MRTIAVAEGVHVCVGADGFANSGFVVGRRGVALIDAQASPALAGEMRAAVESVTGAPVLALILTHHHGDHTFGAACWPEAAVMASARCGEHLSRLARTGRDGRLTAEARLAIFAGELPARALAFLPDHPMRRRLESPEYANVEVVAPAAIGGGWRLDLGGLSVEAVDLGRGHGDDDLCVVVPERDVLFAGDHAFVGRVPSVAVPDVATWSRLSRQLERTNARCLVPGHGEPGPPSSLRPQSDYLELLAVGAESDAFSPFAGMPRFASAHPLNLAVLALAAAA